MAARLIPQWEIIDYASDRKPDAPSGTTRELAARLAHIRLWELTVPLEETEGIVETRGARVVGSQIYALRHPGYTIWRRSSSACRTNGSPSVTTRAAAPSSTWMAPSWASARWIRLSACAGASTAS